MINYKFSNTLYLNLKLHFDVNISMKEFMGKIGKHIHFIGNFQE